MRHFSRAFDWRKLERLQKRALRAVFNDTSESHGTLLQKAKLTTLYDRRLQDILILMNKVKNGLTPTYLRHLFQINCREEGRYHLGNSDLALGKVNEKGKDNRTMAEFRAMIRKKDLSAGVDGCRTNCYICTT